MILLYPGHYASAGNPCAPEELLPRFFPLTISATSRVQLPLLSNSATHHPDCCSSLFIALIAKLVSLLPPDPALTLSIGSGTGLLEALLLQHESTIVLRAVEVTQDVKKHLPEGLVDVVTALGAFAN